MPEYLFENVKTGEIRGIIQKMKDEHLYFGENGKEKDWKRVYVNPELSFDSIVKDPFDKKAFANRLKKGTLGNWYDESAEMSEKRAQKYGKDPVKEKYFDDYEKNRNGKKHYLRVQEEAKKDLDKLGVELVD